MTVPQVITLRINGSERELAEDISITELLTELGYAESAVAVEVNQELVPRCHHVEYVLKAGDQVELVTLVGGG